MHDDRVAGFIEERGLLMDLAIGGDLLLAKSAPLKQPFDRAVENAREKARGNIDKKINQPRRPPAESEQDGRAKGQKNRCAKSGERCDRGLQSIDPQKDGYGTDE